MTTTREMRHILCEVDGAVYEYPNFCREFFHADESRIDEVLEKITGNNVLQRRNSGWSIDTNGLKNESPEIHATYANLLDTIMHAAFQPDGFRPLAEAVVPTHNARVEVNNINGDDSVPLPDIVQGVLCEEGGQLWRDLEFFAECKTNNFGDALMQIARYSQVTFAHQFYRRQIGSIAFMWNPG